MRQPAKAPEAEHRPYILAGRSLPEFTVKVFVLGILLSWIMAAANAYLGLFAALTVSAAIPASVVSMGALRLLRRFRIPGNILENNMIQTTASAGEAVAAGIIFTLPGLLVLGYWKQIGIVETMLIAALGGSLGVFFTIPLRRAFIVEARLQYPEGVATVEVLKAGERGGSGVAYLVASGLVAAAYKFLTSGLNLWKETGAWAIRMGRTGVYFGTTLSPALVGVGFIVGLPVAILIFGGGVISYGVAIPIYLATHAWPTGSTGADLAPVDAFAAIRGQAIRFLGVGAMATGGAYTLYKLRGALLQGFRSGYDAYQRMRREGKDTRIRTEQDINMRTVLLAIVLFAIPLSILFTYFVTEHFTHMERAWVGILLGIIMLFAGFLFSAVAGYMAGVVGSSNNPISGTAIGTILLTALLLVGLGIPGTVGAAATILIGATVASAAAIAGDNLQDLKCGFLLGATPRKLQVMQFVGTLAAALVLPFILLLLDSAYGIGVRPACDASNPAFDPSAVCKPHPLPAPQASLMAAIAGGIFGAGIPWDMVLIGVGIAIAIIALDRFLEARKAGFRTPVLAVAVGMYLPLDTSTPIFLGGLVAYLAHRALSPADADARMSRGVLFSSGLIAGESLVGILIAGLIVKGNGSSPVAVFGSPGLAWPGFLLLIYVAYLLWHSVRRSERAAAAPG
jgi:putative OPT family oligopeptide transporter